MSKSIAVFIYDHGHTVMNQSKQVYFTVLDSLYAMASHGGGLDKVRVA